MISKIFKKVPAGIIVVPMFLASILNTLAPNLLQIGPMTRAFTSKEGLNAIIVVTLVAVGSQLTIKRFGLAFRRGLVLFLSKWLTAIILGFYFLNSLVEMGFWAFLLWPLLRRFQIRIIRFLLGLFQIMGTSTM